MSKVAQVELPSTGANYHRVIRFYPFVGLYIMELCVMGLFIFERTDDGGLACIGQAVIMSLALIITAAYQIWLNRRYSRLLSFLSADARSFSNSRPPLTSKALGEDGLESKFCLQKQGPQQQVIWVPINDSDLTAANQYTLLSRVSNQNTWFDRDGKVLIEGNPPWLPGEKGEQANSYRALESPLSS